MKDMKENSAPVEEIKDERQMSDEQLMEAAAAKRIRRRRIYGITALCVVVLAVAVIAALPSPDRTADTVSVNEEVLSGEVADENISVTLSGAGTLTEEEGLAVTIPDTVTVECYYAENGDSVAAGDRIARVNIDSVNAAIEELQQVMDGLDEQLYEESVKETDENITATVSGRVKMIYAQEGTAVVDTVCESGALMILSLDGRMSAEIECDAAVKVDDDVTVELPDGTELEGRIAAVSLENGTVTVTVSDEEVAYGESVSVWTEDGSLLGRGVLSAHSELKIVGYSGTVSSVDVDLNDTVAEGDILMSLEDTGHTALYTALLARRRELEDQMDSLYALKGDGYVLAECDGVVSGIPDDAVISEEADYPPDQRISNDTNIRYTSVYTGSEGAKIVLLANEPNDTEDNSVMVNYVGQIVSVDNEEKVISINFHKRAVDIDDYIDLKDLGSYPLSEMAEISYEGMSGFAEYDPENEKWTFMDFDKLEPGDHVVITWSFIPETEASEEGSTESAYSIGWIIRFEPDEDEETEETDDETGEKPNNEEADDEAGEEDANELSGGAIDLEGEDVKELSGGETDLKDGFTLRDIGEVQDLPDQTQNFYAAGSSGTDLSFYELSENIYVPLSEEVAEVETYAYETYSISEKEIAQVTPQDVMTIEISVDELDILSVQTGTEVEVTVDALKGCTFTGAVTEIASSGTNSGGNTKYSVEITLDRDEQMLDGMNASVNMITETKRCEMTVPVAALTEENGKTYVYTGYDERKDTLTDPVEVKTGISDETTAEILSGLEAGDIYYYRYAETMTYNFLTPLS